MVKTIATIATGLALATAMPALAGDDIGYSDLVSRLGSTPTGAGVVAATVEARNGSDNFYPDQTSPEFEGKSFIERSGASAASSHATGVAVRQYGLETSMAPGIVLIQLYEAGDWLFGGFLRTGSGTSNPLFNPAGTKVVNTSWVANFEVDGNPMYDLENEAMRRLDFAVNRDGVVLQSEDLDDSEETLGTLAAYLGSSCEATQETLGAERFSTALAVERSGRKLLLVNTRNFYIGVIGSARTQADPLLRDVLGCIRRAASGKSRRTRPAVKSAAAVGHNEETSR